MCSRTPCPASVEQMLTGLSPPVPCWGLSSVPMAAPPDRRLRLPAAAGSMPRGWRLSSRSMRCRSERCPSPWDAADQGWLARSVAETPSPQPWLSGGAPLSRPSPRPACSVRQRSMPLQREVTVGIERFSPSFGSVLASGLLAPPYSSPSAPSSSCGHARCTTTGA
jgi:hypothetical protein